MKSIQVSNEKQDDSLEKQIKKELEEMGILSTEDLEGGEGGGANGGDEVLAELERCQAELKVKDDKKQTINCQNSENSYYLIYRFLI